ncbi:hypothetical protein [Kribbella sp. NBC_00359]|uniref:hypothetical protein n=1 Tax=Kribbella sp. NBC_00359 TaxID=2975966 RepID=UPI002E1A8C6F
MGPLEPGSSDQWRQVSHRTDCGIDPGSLADPGGEIGVRVIGRGQAAGGDGGQQRSGEPFGLGGWSWGVLRLREVPVDPVADGAVGEDHRSVACPCRVAQVQVVESGGELCQGLPDRTTPGDWGMVPIGGQLPAQMQQPPRPRGSVGRWWRGRAQGVEGVAQSVQILPGRVVGFADAGPQRIQPRRGAVHRVTSPCLVAGTP